MVPSLAASFTRSSVVVLSALSYVMAQKDMGLTMVPNPQMTGHSSPSQISSDSSNTGLGYNNPVPLYQSPSDSGSNVHSSLPIETGTPAYGAPPSQYTTPPSQPSDPYQMMPYSSFTNGGYSHMDCSYGYKKGPDGMCTPESWVCSPSPSSSASCLGDLLINSLYTVGQ